MSNAEFKTNRDFEPMLTHDFITIEFRIRDGYLQCLKKGEWMNLCSAISVIDLEDRENCWLRFETICNKETIICIPTAWLGKRSDCMKLIRKLLQKGLYISELKKPNYRLIQNFLNHSPIEKRFSYLELISKYQEERMVA